MIQIDQRIDEERIRQFATQVELITPHTLNFLREQFLWEQGPDYYHGQLAAFCFVYQLLAGTPQQATIGCQIAVLCDHLVKKGWW